MFSLGTPFSAVRFEAANKDLCETDRQVNKEFDLVDVLSKQVAGAATEEGRAGKRGSFV